MTLSKTKHANARLRQRGFQQEVIELIKKYGIAKSKPGKAVELSIPNKVIAEYMQNLKYKMHCFEKCKNKALLCNSNENLVITAYNIC